MGVDEEGLLLLSSPTPAARPKGKESFLFPLPIVEEVVRRELRVDRKEAVDKVCV